MATKKKAKTKAKTKAKRKKPVKKTVKKTVKKAPARKKPVKKKVVARKPAKKPPAAKPAAPRPRPTQPPAAVAGEERVGVVTHYYTHLGVAIIRLESGTLRVGDMIRIKGHTSDFRQRIASMEVEHMHVPEVKPGQEFGLKVIEHAREHDTVYRLSA